MSQKKQIRSTMEGLVESDPDFVRPKTRPEGPLPFSAADLLAQLNQELTSASHFPTSTSTGSSAKVASESGRSEMVNSSVQMVPPILKESPATSAQTTIWPPKRDVLGVEVSITTYADVTRLLIAAAHRRESAVATFLPVHGIVTGATDPSFRYRVNIFDVAAPDGQPVRWAMNWLHKANLPDRVSGPYAMLHLCERAAEEGVGIYLYGSTVDTLNRLKTNLEQKYPGLRVVGVESPPFRALSVEENDQAVDRINSSGAGLVFIGLGSPRQDFFAYNNRHRIQAVQLCVGAAFDFHAGTKKLAPAWMQKCGLEWTYRLMQEPRRLWKRYLVTNTIFVYLMSKRLIRGA